MLVHYIYVRLNYFKNKSETYIEIEWDNMGNFLTIEDGYLVKRWDLAVFGSFICRFKICLIIIISYPRNATRSETHCI